MAVRNYANSPATTLQSATTASATSITLTSVTGLPSAFPYTLIIDRGEASEEVVEATGSAGGTTLNVTRGADSTTAFAHSIGATVEHGISAQDAREANEHINDSTGVHGIGGTSSVVGTDDAQVLTNKDLSDASNIFPDSLATDAEVAAAQTQATSDARPIGEVTMFAGATAPSGWLLCDGTAISRTTYASLYAVLGTAFGSGDGSTTFNLPDYRDRVPVGKSATKALGATGGASSVTLATANLPAHTHSIDHDHGAATSGGESGHTHDITHNHTIQARPTGSNGTQTNRVAGGGGTGTVYTNDAVDAFTGNSGASSGHTHTVNIPSYSGSSGSTGSGSSFSVQNPYQAINYIIKAA